MKKRAATARRQNMDMVAVKVAVVGSRDFNDYKLLKEKLDTVKDRVSLVVSGGAAGADSLAQRWAKDSAKSILIHYPDWEQWGNRAGMIRNKKIIADADVVVAFWDGKSTGTKNSIELAKKLKKKLRVIEF